MTSAPLQPAPAWFALLPVLALAAWWPLAPWWQSDDYVMLHHASDLGRALRDFGGAQYGATEIWLFYRPLIALSFWFDQQIGGTDPWFAQFSNSAAHAVSTLLVALIWRRFAPPGAAFAAGVLWSLHPAHAGAVLWIIGRVDSHTTVWCLLCLWLLLRAREGHRHARWLGPLTLLLGLCTKESALAVPPLCFLLAWLAAPAPTWRRRAVGALAATRAHFVLLVAFLVWRKLVLGVTIGGYHAMTLAPLPMVLGLGESVGNLLDPLLWTAAEGGTRWLQGAPRWLGWVGLAPALLAAGLWLRAGRWRGLLAVMAMFLLAAAPTAPFWLEPDNLHNLRYFYLPWAALVGVLALRGRAVVLLALLVQVPALAALRADYAAANRESATIHAALVRQAQAAPGTDLFVAGLPHTSRNGMVMQLHFGIDRMLVPPLGPGGPTLRALRPFAPLAEVFHLGEDAAPFALPEGRTLGWRGGGEGLVPAPPGDLPVLPLQLEGTTDLTGDALRRLAAGELRLRLHTPGVRPQAYRLTFFTATGYLATVVPDHADGSTPGGLVDLFATFAASRVTRSPTAQTWLLTALQLPATLDLDPTFPVLLEAGSVTPDAEFERGQLQRPVGSLVRGTFTPTHRARTLLPFRFDRGFPAAVRSVLGR